MLTEPNTPTLQFVVVDDPCLAARLDQFQKDVRAVCPYCRGEYADTERQPVWCEAYYRPQSGPPIGAFIHDVTGGHRVLCHASNLRIASPELTNLLEEQHGTTTNRRTSQND